MKNTIVESIDIPTLASEINQGMQIILAEADGREGKPQAGGLERWDDLIAKVRGFRDLEDDWDGLGAKAPDPALVDSAVLFAQLCRQDAMALPSVVVPGLDGCVIFEWQKADVYMEVEICKPGCAEFMKVISDRPAEHKVAAY